METLYQALKSMDIVTVSAAAQKYNMPRQEVINFVQSDKTLRIFDDQKQVWINENVDGHC
jgi:glutamyl-tRNA reductase